MKIVAAVHLRRSGQVPDVPEGALATPSSIGGRGEGPTLLVQRFLQGLFRI